MQKGVLIKNGSDVIEKRCYSGDTAKLDQKLVSEGVQYEIYDDSDPLFINALIKEKDSNDKKNYKNLNDDSSRIEFIAKFLGIK